MICSQARQDRPRVVMRVFVAVQRCPRRHCRAFGFRCFTIAACTRFSLSASSPSLRTRSHRTPPAARIQFCRAAHCRAVTSAGQGGSDKPKNAETYRSLRLASASDSPDASAAAAARIVEAEGHRMGDRRQKRWPRRRIHPGDRIGSHLPHFRCVMSGEIPGRDHDGHAGFRPLEESPADIDELDATGARKIGGRTPAHHEQTLCDGGRRWAASCPDVAA